MLPDGVELDIVCVRGDLHGLLGFIVVLVYVSQPAGGFVGIAAVTVEGMNGQFGRVVC